MTYLETQQWLYKQLPVFHRIGAAAYKIDISNTVDLLSSIGNPHHCFNSIHVAGTNGKGSSSHLIASILKESGKKIGLHTSPHLKDLRERVVVDGKMCSKNYVIRFVKKFGQRLGNVEPSFFELMVAMAFDYFRNKKVETAVVEVGMGGRLDSTNVLSPDCCLITNISFDHQQFLGSTLEQIASEKAGIIKENTPVVISQTQKETKPVFIKKAAEMNAPIFFAEDNYSIKNSRYEDGYLVVDVYRKKEIYLKDLQCPLCGEYQQKNLLGVIQLVEVLNTLGYKITKKNLRDGIGNVQQNFLLQGRWQKLSDNPYTLCDTGHNEDGLTHVVHQLNSIKKNRLNFVLGVVNDKDIDAEIEMLPKDAYYFLCKANIPRGLDVEILANKFAKRKMNYSVSPSVIQAYKEAQRDAMRTNAMVFVGGSTYTVAEVLSEIQR